MFKILSKRIFQKSVRRFVLWGYFLLSILMIVSCRSLFSTSTQLASTPRMSPTIHAEILEHRGLTRRAMPGPWRDVTQLIGYGDRLWFANSVTGINHNSADIYSYDPTTQTTRYERHLFSQAVGTPVVADGLLYWPFEDPRFSADLGEYMVTNGPQWQWRVLPRGQAFHVHTMATHQGTLLAGTGAWSAGLQRSQDGGRTWEAAYRHPTPPRQVSRLAALASFNQNLYGGFTALQSQDIQLMRWEDEIFQAVRAWPRGKRVSNLTKFGNWLYGVNQNLDDSLTLWRTNGNEAEPVAALANYRIRALATDETGLWAVSDNQAGAFLWYSADGVDWTAAHQFEGIRPLDVTTFQGQVYVGGRDRNQHGVLLSSQVNKSSPTKYLNTPGVPPPLPPMPSITEKAVTEAIENSEDALTSAATYRGGDTQDILAQTLLPLALSQTEKAGDALSNQLNSSLPPITANLFENNVQEPAADVARWYTLWAIGLNGQGRVPAELLTQPWTTPANKREKYWQTVPAAAWTVAQIGQADETTVNALLDRLRNSDDPLWLKGDIVGALSVLTGQSFGYDIQAWQNWQQISSPVTN